MSKQPEKLKREDLKKILDKRTASLEKMKLEIKIEASLEAVRAVSLLMKKREDMLQVCTIIAKQLQLLHVKEIRNVQTAIFYEHKGTYTNYEYYAKHDKTFITETEYTNHKIHQDFAEKMLRGNGEFMIAHIKGDKVKEWLAYQKTTNVFIDDYLNTASSLNYYWFSLGPVALGISTYSPLNKKEISLFERFLKVFELSYTRYLDIEKAEAQTREAKIEAALEKVRSRSLAMHKSDEMNAVMEELLQRVRELEINFDAAFIIEFRNDSFDIWSGYEPGTVGLTTFPSFDIDVGYFKDILNTQNSGRELFAHQYSFEEKNKFLIYLFENTNFKDIGEERKEYLLKTKCYTVSIGFAKHTAIQLHSYSRDAFSESENQILKRFVKVFEQAYTRFLDLKKAESQAREAQIELSLERVRAKTMAMHNSADVGETAAVMVEELKKLGIETIRCGIGIMHEPGDMEVWTITSDENSRTGIVIGWMDMNMHPLLYGAFDSWRNKIEYYYYDLKDDDLLNYFNAINNYPGYPIRYDTSALPKQIHHNEFHFAEGTLFAFSLQQLTEEQRKIFKRFAGVFGQTYRRYLDLKKVEGQAREAQIEVALERVRSRTLAMQKSDELAETAAVVFRQLIGLGIEPNRLYITIINDNSGDMEFWITDEDGTRVGNKFSGNAQRNISFQKMYDGWKEHKKSLTIDMHGDELTTYFDHLNSLGVPFKLGLEQKRRVQNLAYFSKGFIGMASPEEQPEEAISLLERFAAVFNLTYARFNDLQIAEHHAEQAGIDLQKLKEEKKRTEDALTELQATQKQLIQSEKMASLGELTAGIAHEIQNPLNFVNNFSEVNKELIDEMNEELEKGNIDEVKIIANDIKENEEKINHHGKRADAIVKGMLQHSRSSTNVKEPTDINKLADEYLRLAYHGLRAKDKSFNATLITDYDESIHNINIIPQDMGRVLLNLYTNAFYAVTEKKKQQHENYEPAIFVSTKKNDGEIFISVKDNGNGIPQKIIDKIFQPFFTTKPTGEGTGLGLSLSYDIIKAHNGNIKAETKEGEGTTFSIQLPII